MRTFLAATLIALAVPALAQAPQRGGTLVFSVTGEPDTYDCHATVTTSVAHRVSPHYSTLLRLNPYDYPKIEGDLAESWEATQDGLTYTFRLRANVRFHDGTFLTSADVKASFERIMNPPQGVVLHRRAQFRDVSAIDTPDPRTVIFRLARANAAMPVYFAGPLNCIYSARRLAENPLFPQRNVMGTGPFRFVEHVAGSEWRGERFDGYFRPGQPYLDGFRAISVGGPALVNALAGRQIMADFRGLAPAERDRVLASRGDSMRVHEADTPGMLMLTFNAERGPTADARVRRALSIAIDRRAGAEPMGRLTFFSGVGGFQRPGSEFARDAQELARQPGFGTDMAANRAEARRLLAEAGHANLHLTLTNRPLYTALGVFLIDQWRQVGATVRHEQAENQPYFAARSSGNFEIIVDAIQDYADEPSLQFLPFLSLARNPANVARARDERVDRLYDLQAFELDRSRRTGYVRELETHLLTEAYTVPLYWAKRIVPLDASIRGYGMTPSAFVGQDLAGVWLAR
ncbi:MAG: ABC transporter substrate-binding protein [Tagaea sp.]